jgi:DNA polymerase-1
MVGKVGENVPQSKLMLIDGNSLLYRAFFALPLLHTREGIYTNGVYGFLTMVNRVLAEQQPTHVLVAFDKDRHTFRNEVYAGYKANRPDTPDELSGQFALLRKILEALNLDYTEIEGYEADDIIGTLSRMAEEAGMETLILTGDRDSLQLVSDKVTVLMTKKGITEMETYTPEKVKERWGVSPEQLIDVKGLMGDSSDNIPGVPGVGEKTAVKLIQEFGSLENLYDHLESVKGKKVVERLSQHREQAFMSRKLGRIIRDIDMQCSLEDYRRKNPDLKTVRELYHKLEFNSLLQSLEEKIDQPQAYWDDKVVAEELKDEDQTARFIAALSENQNTGVLIAADYHHPMWAKIQHFYITTGDKVYHLEVGEKTTYKLEWLRPYLEAPYLPKVFHNAKFAQVLLKRYGIELQGIKGDTLLGAYVYDPSFDGEQLTFTVQKFLNRTIEKDNHLKLASQILPSWETILERLTLDQLELLIDVEMPISTVLADIEFAGVKVEKEILEEISAQLAAGIERNEAEIYNLAGQEFNINSPRQLGKVLFEDLGLPVIKKTKTGYATGAEILEQLHDVHPIIAEILNYRQLTKLKSTYVDALQELIHPETGRIHTIFKQAQTATGRLSSVEPNLQNIPIRMEEGRRIRKAFVAPREDWMIVSADYSQIDLRSLAHISEDEILIDTFRQGIDIHTRTAAEIFQVPLDQVTADLRYRAKAVNFGIIYGISDFGLARDTGVSRKEAKQYIEKYLSSYPGVRRYMEDIVKFGIEHGYVETILKRRRYLPDLKARNKMVQSFARRMALNTPIQGSSADIIKLAMINIYEELQARQLQARLVLQVHDDLILEVPRQEVEQVVALLKDKMEHACTLKVPLEVSVKVGPNWYDMEPVDV